jgi:hypothetical protein
MRSSGILHFLLFTADNRSPLLNKKAFGNLLPSFEKSPEDFKGLNQQIIVSIVIVA